MGTVCEVGAEAAGAIPYTGLIRLAGRDGLISREYLRAVLSSRLFAIQIELLKSGATIQHYGPTHLRQMRLLLPPPHEQHEASAHIDTQHVAFDALTAEAVHAIALLQEHRSALISAAVMGQIDVRGLVPLEAV